MSGGSFDYAYGSFQMNFVDELEKKIKYSMCTEDVCTRNCPAFKEKERRGWCDRHEISKEGLEKLKEILLICKKACILAKGVEWFFSGDIGEEDLNDYIKEAEGLIIKL